MKYLIAVKPCGCPSGHYLHPGSAVPLRWWRPEMEQAGYVVCEADGVPEQRVIDGCPHGSLAAQLAAKLREMEAREAGLKEWLRERIEEEDNASELYRGGVRDPAWVQCQAHSEAFTEVLAKLEGNGQWEGSKQ